MNNMKNWMWMISGFVLGTVTFSVGFAAVPKQPVADSAIYQELSEIRTQKQKDLSFDHDVAQLASTEERYRENLPSLSQNPRIKNPVQRVAQKKYQYSNSPRVKSVRR